MKLTAFTAHFDRPAAWPLCETYLERQTRQPDQWLILDSSPNPITPRLPCDYLHRPDLPKMQDKVVYAIENNLIKGDAVVFWENDDWYRNDWLAWCEKQMERGYEIAGEGNIAYYNVKSRWWSECGNARHAALCQTVVHRDFLPTVANCIKSFDSAFFDLRIWQVEASKYLFMPRCPEERHLVGIKGIVGANGSTGYSGEHRDVMPKGNHPDPALMQLFRWIGQDAADYSQFAER